MKKFQQYINEKLKLDDINKMKHHINWVDVNKIKSITDLEEGNLVKTYSGKVYIVVLTEMIDKVQPVYTSYNYVLARKNPNVCVDEPASFFYMGFESYMKHFPQTNARTEDYKITNISFRKKHYKNIEEFNVDAKKYL